MNYEYTYTSAPPPPPPPLASLSKLPLGDPHHFPHSNPPGMSSVPFSGSNNKDMSVSLKRPNPSAMMPPGGAGGPAGKPAMSLPSSGLMTPNAAKPSPLMKKKKLSPVGTPGVGGMAGSTSSMAPGALGANGPSAASLSGGGMGTGNSLGMAMSLAGGGSTSAMGMAAAGGTTILGPDGKPKVKKKGKGGSSCHQCKSRRNFTALTYCTSNLDKKNKSCRKKFCEHCLKKFYKESPVGIPDKNNWRCPSCRKICCCAACRRRKQRETGVAGAPGAGGGPAGANKGMPPKKPLGAGPHNNKPAVDAHGNPIRPPYPPPNPPSVPSNMLSLHPPPHMRVGPHAVGAGGSHGPMGSSGMGGGMMGHLPHSGGSSLSHNNNSSSHNISSTILGSLSQSHPTTIHPPGIFNSSLSPPIGSIGSLPDDFLPPSMHLSHPNVASPAINGRLGHEAEDMAAFAEAEHAKTINVLVQLLDIPEVNKHVKYIQMRTDLADPQKVEVIADLLRGAVGYDIGY